MTMFNNRIQQEKCASKLKATTRDATSLTAFGGTKNNGLVVMEEKHVGSLEPEGKKSETKNTHQEEHQRLVSEWQRKQQLRKAAFAAKIQKHRNLQGMGPKDTAAANLVDAFILFS